jgi:hypothetical protein
LLRQIYLTAYGTETALRSLNLFDLDKEATVPAWYSSMLMWTAAGLIAFQAIVSRRLRLRTTSHWWALAAIFVYLSMDETSQIHERARLLLPPGFNPGGMFTHSWVIVAAPLLAIGGLAFVPFLLRLPQATAWRIALAAFVYVSGAYGLEIVGNYILAIDGFGNAYTIETLVEEGLELAGLSLFISALVDLLASETAALALRLD